MTTLEMLWRTTYQIVAKYKDKPDESIDGSGFVLVYKGHQLFITADHTIHYQDFEEGLRKNIDANVAIINNINDEDRHQSIQTPIGGFVNWTKYVSINGLIGEVGEDSIDYIPDDMPDVAFAELKKALYPFLTHEIRLDEELIVPNGTPKLNVQSECIVPIDENDSFMVAGCVRNHIVDGEWHRYNAMYDGLTVKERLSEGLVYMSIGNQNNDIKNWEALSGAPVYNQEGRLVGMMLRMSPKDRHVLVMPMDMILRYIDMAIESKLI